MFVGEDGVEIGSKDMQEEVAWKGITEECIQWWIKCERGRVGEGEVEREYGCWCWFVLVSSLMQGRGALVRDWKGCRLGSIC